MDRTEISQQDMERIGNFAKANSPDHIRRAGMAATRLVEHSERRLGEALEHIGQIAQSGENRLHSITTTTSEGEFYGEDF